MLEIANLRLAPRSFAPLYGVDLEISPGEQVLVVGLDRSLETLVEALAGHVPPSASRFSWDGIDLEGLSPLDRLERGYQGPRCWRAFESLWDLLHAVNAARRGVELGETDIVELCWLLREAALGLGIPTWRLFQARQRAEPHDLELLTLVLAEVLDPGILVASLAALPTGDEGSGVAVLKALTRRRARKRATLLLAGGLVPPVTPDSVLVLAEGKIVLSGGWEIVEELRSSGHCRLIPAELPSAREKVA